MIEAIKMYGTNVKYLPKHVIAKDELLGEEIRSEFPSAFTIEVYVDSVDGFEGDGTLMSKFGLEIRDQCTLVVAKRRWAKEVGVWKEGLNPVRPSEGDLIYLPFSKGMFEVKFVEHESPFYQLKNVSVYKLQCELFEYSNEDFNTDDDEVNQTGYANAFTVALQINYASSDAFSVGDEITYQTTGGKTLSGKILNIHSSSTRKLIYVGFIGISADKMEDFTVNGQVTNGTITASIVKVFTLQEAENQTALNDKQEQNHLLEQRASDILDFSETNPFSEPGNN